MKKGTYEITLISIKLSRKLQVNIPECTQYDEAQSIKLRL